MARTRPACAIACYYSAGSARTCECVCGGENHGLAHEHPTGEPIRVAGRSLYPARITGDSRPVGERRYPEPASSPPRPARIITADPATLDAMTDRQYEALDQIVGVGEVSVVPAQAEDPQHPARAVVATHALGQALIHEDGEVQTLREARVVSHLWPTGGAHAAPAPAMSARARPAGPWD